MRRPLIFIVIVNLVLAGLLILTFVKKRSVETTSAAPGLSKIKHVFVIFEENHNWHEIYSNPEAEFMNKILAQGAYAANYHNISPELHALHPSLPNYILATAGKVDFPDHVFTTNNLPSTTDSTSSHDHLAYLFDKHNLTWKTYQEDISGNVCPINEIGNYAPKHNPFVYFQDISGNPPTSENNYCREHIRPFEEFQNDLNTGNPANFIFISPNALNNMHDGTIKQADDWLNKTVTEITNSEVYKKDGAIFITWDEGSGDKNENDPIGMIILSPFVKPGYTNSKLYTHASLVKTVQEIFQLTPLLGMAADKKTTDLSDFFSK